MISRNVVNNLETTTSNKVLEATKMLMSAAEASPEELGVYSQQKKQVEMVSQLRQAFLEYDDNHSGEMSFEEFCKAFRKMNWKSQSDREMQTSFSRFDKDGSGYISENE